MRISPEHCHENARLCVELAKTADTPKHSQVLRNLAKQWLRLAFELAGACSLVGEREPARH